MFRRLSQLANVVQLEVEEVGLGLRSFQFQSQSLLTSTGASSRSPRDKRRNSQLLPGLKDEDLGKAIRYHSRTAFLLALIWPWVHTASPN